MSDFHVLEQADDMKTVSMVFHILIPDQVNAVGVNLRTALVNYLGGADAITSKVADSAELAQMKAGEVFEHHTVLRFSILGLTDEQKLAELTAFYNATVGEIQTMAQSRLQYYGFAADV